MDDLSYEHIFRPIMNKIMDVYRPGAIVLQCGADSLVGDRLGCFNLTLDGHARCVEYVKNLNVPTLVLGGGGYTVRNVARCWSYETSVLLNMPIKDEMIPVNDYFEYFGPDYKLQLTKTSMENMNSYEYLEKNKNIILENLGKLKGAPSVQFQDVPPDTYIADEFDDDTNEEKDTRMSINASDRHIGYENDYYEDDYDVDHFDDL